MDLIDFCNGKSPFLYNFSLSDNDATALHILCDSPVMEEDDFNKLTQGRKSPFFASFAPLAEFVLGFFVLTFMKT